MRATPRPLTALAVTALVAGGAALGLANAGSEGDTASAAAPPVADVREWCSTIRSVDRQLELASSTQALGFEEQQAALTRAYRLLIDLEGSTEVLPADGREAVGGTLEWALDLTGAMATARDRAEAEAKAAPIYETATPDAAAATAWIKQECGVGLDD